MEEDLSAAGSPDIISVLKPPRPRIPLKDIMSAANDEDNTANRKRRVSFANVNKIKEFSAGAESMVVCHTPAYEEPFSMSSDSSYPSGVDGATPAKENFSNSNALITNAQELFPPQCGSTYLHSSDNSTVHFPTSRQSLGIMDMTDCVENHLELVGSSTRYSVGMDLTNVQGGLRNSTRNSMGMDLTNAGHSMAKNSTRFSVGMDLTSVVEHDSRMSLSDSAMDFTKAAMSRQHITDQSVNFHPDTDPNLDDSSGLEITEAIKHPLQFASLYTVNNENTRYSMNTMDITNCSSARRKSLVNMDLTDTVSEGNNSGLDFTEVINNPIIEAASTRYSLSNMDLTEAAGRKTCNRFSTNSNCADVSSFNLEYSANSETSMNFTKPICNANVSVMSRASIGLSNSSKLGEEQNGKKSTCLSAKMEVPKPFVGEENTYLCKTLGEVSTQDFETSNMTYVMSKVNNENIEKETETGKQDNIINNKLVSTSFKCDLTKVNFSESTTNRANLECLVQNFSINQTINKSQCLKNTESFPTKTNMSDVLFNNQNCLIDANFDIYNQPTEVLQQSDSSLFVNSKKSSNHYEDSENASQTTEAPEQRETHNYKVSQSNCEIMNPIETIQQTGPTHSTTKGRKSMVAGNLETLLSEFQDDSSIMEISAMSIEDENPLQAENAIKETRCADSTLTNIKTHQDCYINESLNTSFGNKSNDSDNSQSETNTQHRNEKENRNFKDAKSSENSCQQLSFSSSSSLSPKNDGQTETHKGVANESLHVLSVNDNSYDQSYSNTNITLTRGAASRFSTVFSLPDLSTENETESSEFSDPSKGVTAATSGFTPEYRKGKRSFEVALESENSTEESPVKQICLSGEDLISNVTAPSFLMETLREPNETITHSNKSGEATFNKTQLSSPVNMVPRDSPAKMNVTVVHENTSKDSSLAAIHDIMNISTNKTEINDFANSNRSNFIIDESFNVEVRRSPRKMDVCEDTLKNDVPKALPHNDSFDLNSHSMAKKTSATNRLSPSINKLKSMPIEMFDDLSELSEEDLLERLKCYSRPKETQLFSGNRRIKHVRGNEYSCDVVKNWIELHFTVDLEGHLIESSYKLSCDVSESERPIGEFLLRQLICHMPPQTANELVEQLTAPAFSELARFGEQLSNICLFLGGKLNGEYLTVQVVNLRQNFWAFVEINVNYKNLKSSDVTVSEQRIGKLELSKVREIFNSTEDGPDRLIRFVKELYKLKFG